MNANLEEADFFARAYGIPRSGARASRPTLFCMNAFHVVSSSAFFGVTIFSQNRLTIGFDFYASSRVQFMDAVRVAFSVFVCRFNVVE
jgi:hypothetical protein